MESSAPPIEKYVVNHDFPTRSRHDPGFGVFSNVKGGPVVSFSCKDKRIAYLHDKKNGLLNLPVNKSFTKPLGVPK